MPENADIPWLNAELNDVEVVDFEEPILLNKSADCHDLHNQYRNTLESSTSITLNKKTPAGRVFMMLESICGMHFRADDPSEPFAAMIAWGDGSRTAIPADFKDKTDVIRSLAGKAKNPVLRARLSDVCWVLDKRMSDVAMNAIASYVDIVQKIEKNELELRFEPERGVLRPQIRDILKRALQIGRRVGWDKDSVRDCRNLVISIRKKAIQSGSQVAIAWFSALDCSFRLSDPAEVGREIESVLTKESEKDWHLKLELLRLAARCYHLAKQEDNKNRCLLAAAVCLVDHARSSSQALVTSHFLSEAISQLHGLPSQKDFRTKLRHELIDIQSRISEEMTSFSQELDLEPLIRQVEESLVDVNLLTRIFVLADLARSPDPQKLIDDAKNTILRHPLSSIFSSSHLDREGKTIKKTAGGGFGEPDSDAVIAQIAQGESIRRKLVCAGQIEPALHFITARHHLTEEILTTLLVNSFFVPREIRSTYARGFLHMFRGDMLSAVYILTPILEASLRHLLKINGVDVTIYDDASQTQQDRTISSLFETLREELDRVISPSIAADLERAFLQKPGPYIRHSVAHGLLHDGEPYGADCVYACWLLFRICLLPLMPHLAEMQEAYKDTELGQVVA